MPNLHVSWDQYNTLVERLALTVYESGFRFNQIICIARGGLRVGDVMSRIYEQPLAILSTHSYAAEGGTIRGELVIAEHMTMTRPRLGDKVLLVDDMVDSGHTLAAVHAELPKRFPHITALRTAVLWWKACSVVKPDYLRRPPARQPLDPPAVRGLRHAASRRPARAARGRSAPPRPLMRPCNGHSAVATAFRARRLLARSVGVRLRERLRPTTHEGRRGTG